MVEIPPTPRTVRESFKGTVRANRILNEYNRLSLKSLV